MACGRMAGVAGVKNESWRREVDDECCKWLVTSASRA
jgi:hypothetical protein